MTPIPAALGGDARWAKSRRSFLNKLDEGVSE